MKKGLLMYVYVLLYVYLYVLGSYKLVFLYSFDFLSEFGRLTLFINKSHNKQQIIPVTKISTISFYLNMLFLSFGM